MSDLYNNCSLVCILGSFLAAGFTDGSVYILDSISLENDCKEFKYSRGPVTQISFSHDSQYLATAVSFSQDICIYSLQHLLVGLELTGCAMI